jgi:broad specificity phosphatase PhoE
LTVPAHVRSGAIVLARHGEPDVSRKVKLTAREYGEFWSRYELLGLKAGQIPPELLRGYVDSCGVLISSTRLRAIESAQVLGLDREFSREEILIEAPLPPPPWPSWIRMSPRLWGFFARFWWWYFNHHKGQENRVQAEARAGRAAEMLIAQAERGCDVVVLAHGFFNVLIGRQLKRRGWRLEAGEGYKYWSIRRFVKEA